MLLICFFIHTDFPTLLIIVTILKGEERKKESMKEREKESKKEEKRKKEKVRMKNMQEQIYTFNTA
jgi:hypothetical protein